MRLKMVCALCLVLSLLLAMTVIPVYATDTSQSYCFTVTADELERTVGDPSALVVALKKDGADDSYVMYASAVVLRYDGRMFEADQVETRSGVTATVSELSGSWQGWKAVTLNVLVGSVDGEIWDNPTELAKISLRSVGQGVSTVSLKNGVVSTSGGMDSYEVSLGEVTLKVRSDQADESTPVIPGDINDDGKVNGKDATRLAKYLVGTMVLSERQLQAADVNNDGSVNGKDATRLAKYLVGSIPSLN